MVPAGVLWGYRDREELLAAGARFLSSHPEELERVFA
jgi:phosphoglycolate phosphatase-like HAD superfamily hydrolase